MKTKLRELGVQLQQVARALFETEGTKLFFLMRLHVTSFLWSSKRLLEKWEESSAVLPRWWFVMSAPRSLSQHFPYNLPPRWTEKSLPWT